MAGQQNHRRATLGGTLEIEVTPSPRPTIQFFDPEPSGSCRALRIQYPVNKSSLLSPWPQRTPRRGFRLCRKIFRSSSKVR